VTIYLVFVFFVLLLSFSYQYTKIDKHIILFLIIICLVIFAGFRGKNVDRDYSNYLYKLENATTITKGFKLLFAEPASELVKIVATGITSKPFVYFLIFAILGVSIKVYVITKYSQFFFLSMCLYLADSFFLHEMTQIRAGVGIGIFLYALQFIKKRQFVKYFIAIIIASFFHLSIILTLPFYTISTKKTQQLLYLILFILSFFSGIIIMRIINSITVYNSIIYRLTYYMKLNLTANFKNPLLLLRYVIVFFVIYQMPKIKRLDENALLYTKIFIFSVMFFNAFSFMPAVGLRLRELFGSVEILLFPMYVRLFKEKRVAAFFLFLLSIGIILGYLFVIKLLEPYSFII